MRCVGDHFFNLVRDDGFFVIFDLMVKMKKKSNMVLLWLYEKTYFCEFFTSAVMLFSFLQNIII